MTSRFDLPCNFNLFYFPHSELNKLVLPLAAQLVIHFFSIHSSELGLQLIEGLDKDTTQVKKTSKSWKKSKEEKDEKES